MLIIETTKEDLILAKAEINTFQASRKYKNFFYVKESFPYQRLALANSVYRIIGNNFPQNYKAPKTFKFQNKKKIAPHIKFLKTKGATINLSAPEKTYAIINSYLTELIYINPKSYLKRNPKYRPGFHPAACSAKLAKLLVNLAGPTKSILDPFCGTGGVLIEGSLTDIKMFGSDINIEMLQKTETNLNHYNCQAKLIQIEATKVTGSYDAIATELPFGTSTILNKPLKNLFQEFMDHAKKLTNKVIIVAPDKPFRIKGWKKTFTRNIYIHKSLSKRIYVFKK